MASKFEDFITCPYNRYHLISKKKFQIHLIKCASANPKIKLRRCPFNTIHLVRPKSYDEHVLNCEDRHNYETYKYTCPTRTNSVTTECQQVTNVQDTISVCLPEGGENWDDECVESYDPQKYCRTAPIIRKMPFAPPSERRAFKEAERLRLNRMQK